MPQWRGRFRSFSSTSGSFSGFYPVLNRNQKFEEDDNRYVNMQYINIATSNVKGIVLTLFLNRIFINDLFPFFFFELGSVEYCCIPYTVFKRSSVTLRKLSRIRFSSEKVDKFNGGRKLLFIFFSVVSILVCLQFSLI